MNHEFSVTEDIRNLVLKKWYSRDSPLHLKVSSLPCYIVLTNFIALGHKLTIEVDRKKIVRFQHELFRKRRTIVNGKFQVSVWQCD